MKISIDRRLGNAFGKARRAFTLVELLVAIAIIAIVVALLFPAVQSSREAARRTECKNNLRQIALGMHHHEGQFGHLPTGGWGWRWHGEPERGFGLEQPGGWIYNVLPFVEQAPLRELGSGLTGFARQKALQECAATPVSLFVCSSRRAAREFPFVHPVDYVNLGRPADVARSDYAACSGDVDPDVSGGRGRGPTSLPEGDSPNFHWLDTDHSGVVFRRSRVSLAVITDGLSNTYLVGEKYLARGDYATGKAQNDDQHMLVGFDMDTLRTTDLNAPPQPDSSPWPGDYSFGSAHAGTFHMAMADGAVVSIDYAIALDVHQARGNRHDGIAVSPP